MISEQIPSTSARTEPLYRQERAVPPPSLLDRAFDLSRLNVEYLLYGVLFLVSVVLHLYNLGHMAMAHDESVHGYMSWKFFSGRGGFTCAGGIANETYCYDPVYHGPTLYFLTFLSFFLFGDNDASARLPQALSGIALLPMCWLLRPVVGKRVAFVSAVLVTLSPSLLYFSRYARHDALMALWTMFMVVGIFRWLQSGRTAELALAAAGLALGWATHELIFILGFTGVTFFVYRWLWEYRPRWFTAVAGAAVIIGGAVVVATIVATTGTTTYKLLQRLLGPAMLFGGGGLLAFLISGAWERTPLLTDRVRATWSTRPNADPDRPRSFWGVLPSTFWWAIGAFLVTFGLLFSVFFAYPRGFFDGFYRGLQYWWLSQHEYARGGQPWYYYFMLVPVYELLALLFTFGGIVALLLKRRPMRRAQVVSGIVAGGPGPRVAPETWNEGEIATEDGQPVESFPSAPESYVVSSEYQAPTTSPLVEPEAVGDEVYTNPVARLFVPFTLYWAILSFIAYSWAGEKMPWLVIHIALPLTLFAASVIAGIIARVPWQEVRARRGWAVPLLAFVALVTLFIGSYFAAGAGNTLENTRTQVRAIPAFFMTAVALAGLYLMSQRLGRATVLRLATLTMAGVLLLYGVRSISLVVYDHPDTPVEPLIYTQTSPDIPPMVDLIRQTAINQTRNERTKDDPTGSYSMKVVLDNELAWPMQWYLRDFRSLSWMDLTKEQTLPADAPIMLVHTPHMTDGMREEVAETHVKYAEGVFNWWFPENGTVPDPRDPNKQVRAYKELVKDKPWQVLLWPFNPDNWPGLGKFMLYREVPHKLEGRELEMYMSLDTAPVPGGEILRTPQSNVTVVDAPLTPLNTLGTGQLNNPRGIALDPQGNAYVADALNHRLMVFNPQGEILKTIGTQGSGDGQFYEPSGVSFDAQGNIYVADTWNARIVKLTPDGTFVKAWGSGNSDFGQGKRATDTNGDAAQNQANPLGFYGPRNVLVIGDRVYIADTGNKRIVATDLDGNYVEQFGTWGKSAGQFHEPIGLGKDAQDRLYVGDTWNSRVQVFTRDAEQRINPQPALTFRVRGWSANSYNDPFITVAPDGRTIVAVPERQELSIYDAAGNLTTRLKDAQVAAPHGLIVGADNQALVVDGSGKVVQFRLP